MQHDALSALGMHMSCQRYHTKTCPLKQYSLWHGLSKQEYSSPQQYLVHFVLSSVTLVD